MADAKDNKVINVKKANLVRLGYADLEAWKKDPNHEYIGRHVQYVPGATASKWGNPFTVKKYGLDQCLIKYREYAVLKFTQQELLSLRGKTLGCWCKPGKCHGDILAELAASV